MLKEARRLSSINAHIIDYRCDLLDVKHPRLGGNTVSDLLSSSLVRQSNPIKKMFTEVNKYRMISKISEDFMNTIGIHFVTGRTERTNLRFLMDDFTCELDFHVGIVNITHCVNMVATPRKPAPSVSEGFDVELGSGTLVLLEQG